MIDIVLNEAELATDPFIHSPSLSSIDTTSIVSYKTENSITSRKSRYNALPRRKYADIVQPSLLAGLVSKDVNEASASVPKVSELSVVCPHKCINDTFKELSEETFPSLLSPIPIPLNANFVEEGRPNLGA